MHMHEAVAALHAEGLRLGEGYRDALRQFLGNPRLDADLRADELDQFLEREPFSGDTEPVEGVVHR